MKAIAILLTAVIAANANNDTILLSAKHLNESPSHDTWGLTVDRLNNYNGIESYGTLPTFSFEELLANTNTTEFAAWLEAKTADATDDQALAQELLTGLSTAIQAEWGVTFTGDKGQVRTLTRRLAQEAKTARLILEDSNNTIEQRLDAIAKLRRLDAISGYANQLGIGARK